jgi:hypothetical protein
MAVDTTRANPDGHQLYIDYAFDNNMVNFVYIWEKTNSAYDYPINTSEMTIFFHQHDSQFQEKSKCLNQTGLSSQTGRAIMKFIDTAAKEFLFD